MEKDKSIKNTIEDNEVRKQKLEMDMLRTTLEKEKKEVEQFLEDVVSSQLLSKIKEFVKELLVRTRKLEAKQNKTAQEKAEINNTKWVLKKFKFKKIRYWQLLQLFYKFPSNFQIGMDKFLLEDLALSEYFEQVKKYIPAQIYVEKSWSFKRFLSDCIAFARLRRLQLKYMKDPDNKQTPFEKIEALKKDFAIIPDQFLLERRLGQPRGIGIFKGMDLSKNVPIVIKYLPQHDKTNTIQNIQEEKRRFEREAQAFEKLERHRQAKEQAAAMLVEKAKRQIDEGRDRSNTRKMRTGFALLKQGHELLCDRYFVKTYCLATGQLSNFELDKQGILRTPPQNVAFMVMEYVEGMDLGALIHEYKNKKINMPIRIFILVMEELLKALNYCHSEGIIHRDIRPDNVLITRKFKIRITSLGRAKVEDMTQLTAQGAFVGTPGYAAPEGIVNEFKDIKTDVIGATDHRFDLYSLGCVAYEMLTGNPPFTSKKKDKEKRELEILNKHLKKDPAPLSNYRDDIPPGIENLVMRLLAKSPDARFESAQDTLKALNNSLSVTQKASKYTHHVIDSFQATQEESIMSQKKKSFIGRVAVFLLFLLFLSTPFLFYYRNDIIPKAKKLYNKVTNEIMGVWHQDKQERLAVLNILNPLEELKEKLEKEWGHSSQLLEDLNKNYPSSEDYPIPNDKLGEMLKKVKKEILYLEAVIKAGKRNLQRKGGKFTLRWIKQYKSHYPKNNKTQRLLERISKKIRFTHSLAQKIKQSRDEIYQIRKGVRVLGNDFFKAKENIALIKEKLDIVNERYPKEQKYPSLDPNTLKSLKEKQDTVNQLSRDIVLLNKNLIQNKLSITGKLLSKYKNFSKIPNELYDIDDNIKQLIRACKTEKQRRERELATTKALIALREKRQILDNNLKEANHLYTENIKFYKTLKKPELLFSKAKSDLEQVKKIYAQLTTFVTQNDKTKALKLAKSYNQKIAIESINELKDYNQKRKVQLRIAKAAILAKKKAQDIKYQQERITEILSLAKSRLNAITSSYNDWNEIVTEIKKEHPNFLYKIQYREKLPANFKKISQWLKQVIKSSEDKIVNQKLLQAYQDLTKQKSNIESIKRYIALFISEKEKASKILEYAKVARAKYLTKLRCQRILDKLDKYIKIMQSQIAPLRGQISKLKDEFQPMKYPQVSKEIEQILATAQNNLYLYRNKREIASQYLRSNLIQKALNTLLIFEGTRLSGYSKFRDKIEYIQEEIIKTRKKCERLRATQGKMGELNGYIIEITEREKDLKKVSWQLSQKLKILEKYTSKKAYKKADPNIKKALQDTVIEMSDLKLLLKRTNKLVKEKKYHRATALIKPYSNKVNPGFSLLPLLKTYLKQCNGRIATNRRLDTDKAFYNKTLAKQQAKEMKKIRLQKLQTSPGDWYDTIRSSIELYLSLDKEILNCLQGKGSLFVHSRIRTILLEMRRYPKFMAELKEIEEDIIKQGKTLPKTPRTYKDKEMLKYLDSHKIDISLSFSTSDVETVMEQIQKQIKSSWVEEATIRNLLRKLQEITRKFDDKHESIKSSLLSIHTN